jgi:hypothetical protein
VNPAEITTIFSMIRGDDISIVLTITDQDDAVIDLTDAVCFFTVKEKIDDIDDDAVIAIDWDTHIDAVNGETSFDLIPSDTSSLAISKYFFDIQVKLGDTTIHTPVRGIFKLVADVTIRTVAT